MPTLQLDDFHTPLGDKQFQPGTIYLVYGSDQQVKLELMKRGIPYTALFHPTYSEVESELKNGPVELFDGESVDALLIFPKQFKTIDDRKLKKEDQYAFPNYQKMIVSDRRICFVVGDPHGVNPKDLKNFYKKLEGGNFVSLAMPSGYGVEETPEEWSRFPLTYAQRYEGIDVSEQALGESLLACLGTREGVERWRRIPRSWYYRLFMERGAGCASIVKLLIFSSGYKCRDLIPWLSPFLNRLNRETWVCPGDLLGRFALWVYRASHVWARPYKDGLKRYSKGQRSFLIFAPSIEAVDQYRNYLAD